MTPIAAAMHDAAFTAPLVMAIASETDAWLGWESVHPLTWVPGMTGMTGVGSADRSSGPWAIAHVWRVEGVVGVVRQHEALSTDSPRLSCFLPLRRTVLFIHCKESPA